LSLCAARYAAAQPLTRIEGTAFDSVAGRPFAGALVTARGTSRSVFTDAQGRFQLDSLPYGRYRLDLNTPALDSLGLGALSSDIVADAAITHATIALPAFETIARRLCGSAPPAVGSQTIILGVVHDARSGRVLPDANVEYVGSDLLTASTPVNRPLSVQQRTWTGKAESGDDGTFALCGLPEGVPIEVSASKQSLSMGTIQLTLAAHSIVKQELWLAPLEDETSVGIVRGTVTDAESNRPIADVQVVVAGAEPVRTNGQGQFIIARTPLGTREIEFKRIGVEPVRRHVNIRAGRTSAVDIAIRRLALLETVRIDAVSHRQRLILDMERRRELKLGYFADSTELLRYPSFQEAIRMASGKSSVCAIYIDGAKKLDDMVLQDYKPHMIAQLEIQTNFTPIEYQQKKLCPVLFLWTKLGLP
jgi:hypothetical protein